ncbi:hypothetical protein BsWGS_20800 [Bradybaena similaris]
MFFIIGLTIVLAKVCYSRMERMRKEHRVKNIIVGGMETEPDYELRSVGIPPEVESQVPRRMSAYRPKILSEEEEAEFQKHLTQVNSKKSGHSNHWINTPRHPYEQNDTSEIENMTIVHADNSDENRRYEYERRQIRTNGFINESDVPVSFHQNFGAQTINDNFNGLLEQRQDTVRIVEQSRSNDLKHGHVDSSSERNVSRGGHIIKHIVTDGRHVLQQKDDNGVINQHWRRNNIYLPSKPTDAESIQRYIGHSSENMDGSMIVSKSSSKDNDYHIIRESVSNVKSVSAEHNSPNISINRTLKDNKYRNTSRDISDNREYIRREARNSLITQEANDDGWEADIDEEIEKHGTVHKHTELTVSVYHDKSDDVDLLSSEIPGNSNENLRVSRQEDNASARSSKRGEDSMSLFYSDSNNYKGRA